jgi:alpha-ketoglutarate-dependent taurine dioxygenase
MTRGTRSGDAHPFRLTPRRRVELAPEALVRMPAEGTRNLPALVEATAPEVNAPAWAEGHRAWIERTVLHHGGILFRGFQIRDVRDFHTFVRAISGEPLAYTERSSPRSAVGQGIYTSTDYPPDQAIFPHNEHSYKVTFPLKLYFFCEQPARTGGRTPLVDARALLDRIPSRARERFLTHGWLYVRTLGPGLGLPWQTVFQTTDRETVEAYCRASSIAYEWLSGDRLRTSQVRPVTCVHPTTGDTVWFNHATFFHATTLPEAFRARLIASYREDEFPNHTYYGDGSPIDDDTAEQLRAAYRAEMTSFDWHAGDVLLIDNLLTAHAREAFEGPRQVLVAMADPFRRSDIHAD